MSRSEYAYDMYDTFDAKTVKELASARGPCVSILVPTAATGRERLTARIHLRNAVVHCEDALVSQGMRRTIAKDLLAPAKKLEEDESFWMTQEDGLAVYISENIFRVFRLPERLQELAVVAPRFHLRPLLALAEEPPFYVLALDKESSRLLRVRDHRVKEVHVPEMPERMMALVGVEHHEKQQQRHAAGRPGRAGGSITHGSGEHVDAKDQSLRYCQAVDRAVSRYLARSSAPLVLAADLPISDQYPKTNHYAHLLDRVLVGSPRRESNEMLRDRAAEIIEPLANQRLQLEKERYARFVGTGMVSDGIEQIVTAAQQGRVDVLITPTNLVDWGKVNQDGSVTTVVEQDPETEDLINVAALATIENGGTYLETQPTTDENRAIAIFRV